MRLHGIRMEDGRLEVAINGVNQLDDLARILAALRPVLGEREPGDDDAAVFLPSAGRVPSLVPAAVFQEAVRQTVGEASGNGAPKDMALPTDLAPFKGMGAVKEVLVRLAETGVPANWGAEEYIRACLALKGLGTCPVLDRVPNLVERVIRSLTLLKLVTFDPPDQADAVTDALVAKYDARAG